MNQEYPMMRADPGMTPYYADRAQLARQVARETQEWADVIRKAGVTFG